MVTENCIRCKYIDCVEAFPAFRSVTGAAYVGSVRLSRDLVPELWHYGVAYEPDCPAGPTAAKWAPLRCNPANAKGPKPG